MWIFLKFLFLFWGFGRPSDHKLSFDSLENGDFQERKNLNWLRFLKADSLNAGFLGETKPLFLTLCMAGVVYLCIVHKSELTSYPIYLFSKYYVRKQPAALLDFTLRWFWFMSSFAALSGRLFLSLHTRTLLCSSVVVDVRNSLLPPGGLAGLCASFQPFSRHLREREIYIYIFFY